MDRVNGVPRQSANPEHSNSPSTSHTQDSNDSPDTQSPSTTASCDRSTRTTAQKLTEHAFDGASIIAALYMASNALSETHEAGQTDDLSRAVMEQFSEHPFLGSMVLSTAGQWMVYGGLRAFGQAKKANEEESVSCSLPYWLKIARYLSR